MPDYLLETEARANGVHLVAGVDEVGRGPLAGPVVAAAVILDPDRIPKGLKDSKKLTTKRRDALFEQIVACADYALGEASVDEIHSINILQASMLAMRRALGGLLHPPALALIDGNRVPEGLNCRAQAIIGGDDRVLSIAAASIVAKVTRDALMRGLARSCPGYGWETNAGYGTRQHLEALKRLGVTPHHRVSFRPVHNILCQDNN
ncbi:MAG: ribonuclease HII [Paracoccaceae bacterium]